MDKPLRTILVADDEFSIIETLTDILSWEGWNVISASNGERALLAVEQARPNLALIDFMMPVMDGVALARKLRERYPDIPIVMMTAAPAALPKEPDLWDELLVKPFDLDALIATVKRVADQPRRK
ncbi:MAG: response regulator [Myxococcaceae bacterium]